MDTPGQVREIRDEAERRMIGGPDAIASYDLLPPEAKEAFESDPTTPVAALWDSWFQMTTWLHSLGFSQRTLCDATTAIAESRTATVGEGHRQTA
jgi:hypothetical protein